MAPIVDRLHIEAGRDGAIAQLGERVVRNDEVGGSIPPGSTTLRPSGYAWRSHESRTRSVPGMARRATTGCIGHHPFFELFPRKPWRPLFHEAGDAFAKIA